MKKTLIPDCSTFQMIMDSLKGIPVDPALQKQRDEEGEKFARRREHYLPDEYKGMTDEAYEALSEEEQDDYDRCFMKADLRACGDPSGSEGAT